MQIGTVSTITRYPVKSMRGESLDVSFVSFSGLIGDRVYAIIDKKKEHSDFPYFTVYDEPELLLYQPHYSATSALDKKIPIGKKPFDLMVTTPDKKVFKMSDPKFLQYLEKRYKKKLDIRFSERNMYHSRPLSLLSQQTINALQIELKRDFLDPMRFRENLIVTWMNDSPFYEDTLCGKHLRIGNDVEICFVKKDHRCMYTTYDPFTLDQDAKILKQIALKHDSNLGVYATILKNGMIQKNDPILLLSSL